MGRIVLQSDGKFSRRFRLCRRFYPVSRSPFDTGIFPESGRENIPIQDASDEPLHRRHIDIGTKFVVPNHKLKYGESNPTGHGIDFVLCYVPPGGV